MPSYIILALKVEYTLSFEDYLEMTANRRVQPDYVVAILFAVIGFFLLACGGLWLHFWPGHAPFIGFTLVASGVLMTFVALPMAAFAKQRPVPPDKCALKKEFVRYSSEPRTLEFDEQGWKVRWHDGDDVRPWPALKAIHNLKSLLVLSTETTPYWLPKAALKREGQLERLWDQAKAALRSGNLLFTVPACPSAFSYAAAMLAHNLRRARTTRLIAYCTVMLMVYWFGFSNPEYPKAGPIWLILLVPVVLALFEGLYYVRGYFQTYRRKVSPRAEIMSDGIGYETDTVSWIVKYRRFTEVREIPGALLLYINPQTFYLLSKRGFSKEQLGRFKELLFANMEQMRTLENTTR